mmetsp:Transcript_2917/g.6341  ORF Transcript_2917/g.6341 Transcript_2917/m.6341 type:complete len:266 (-) Transcript_2917:642-1439(-)
MPMPSSSKSPMPERSTLASSASASKIFTFKAHSRASRRARSSASAAFSACLYASTSLLAAPTVVTRVLRRTCVRRQTSSKAPLSASTFFARSAISSSPLRTPFFARWPAFAAAVFSSRCSTASISARWMESSDFLCATTSSLNSGPFCSMHAACDRFSRFSDSRFSRSSSMTRSTPNRADSARAARRLASRRFSSSSSQAARTPSFAARVRLSAAPSPLVIMPSSASFSATAHSSAPRQASLLARLDAGVGARRLLAVTISCAPL